MQLLPPNRITDDGGPLTRRNSARGSAALLRSPAGPSSAASVTNNRLYRAPQATIRSSITTVVGDRVGDALFGNIRGTTQQPPSSASSRPSIHHHHHHQHGSPLSPRLPNSDKGEPPASVGATAAGTRRRRRGEFKGGHQSSQSQQQPQRPTYQMEKQPSEDSLGCISITKNKEKGGGGGLESSYSSISNKFCLSPHNGMPAPPLWTDDVMLRHLSPPPLFSSLSPKNNNNNNNNKAPSSCVSSSMAITPPCTHRLSGLSKQQEQEQQQEQQQQRSSIPGISSHSHHRTDNTSSHHSNNHNISHHAAYIIHDHSEGPYLLDEDSFRNASPHHQPHHHAHSSLSSNHHIRHHNNGYIDAHHTNNRNLNNSSINSSLRIKQQQHRQQQNRFCIQRVIRNSCWYAALSVQPASHGGNGNSNSRIATTKKTWRLFYAAFKVLVVAACAGFVYDSHHRVRTHKEQMQEYESERAHILEQMIWIDQAAKKVHKKYSSSAAVAAAAATGTTLSTSSMLHKDLAGKITTSTSAATASTATTNKHLQALQSSLDKLQVRIQLNARDLLAQKFGDRPVQVSLQIKKRLSWTSATSSSSMTTSTTSTTNSDNIDNDNNNDKGHLVVALSDDTPHATATIVQQIDGHFWDDLEFETITTTSSSSTSSDSHSTMKIQAIQIVPKNRNSASPLLEFVEPSRKCHSVGSVALRQVPQGPFHHVLVLRIYLTEQQQQQQPPTVAQHYGNDYDEDEEQEVCIGRVLHGLDQILLPEFLIQERRQEMEPLAEPALPHRQGQHDRQEEEELGEQRQQQRPPEPLLPEQDEEYHGQPPEEDIPIDLLQPEHNTPQPPSVLDMMMTTTMIQSDSNHDHYDMLDETENNYNNENMVDNDYPSTNTNMNQQHPQTRQKLRGSHFLADNNHAAREAEA